MTVRRPVEHGSDGEQGAETRLLRPIYRGRPGPGRGGQVPLRAWYPVEVFQFPRAESRASAKRNCLAASPRRTLVVDERLRDALRALRDGQGFRLPADGVSALTFRSPDVVDDAAYAVECAAVGEVDLLRLDRQYANWRTGSLSWRSGSGRGAALGLPARRSGPGAQLASAG